jgi:hypothetical protein
MKCGRSKNIRVDGSLPEITLMTEKKHSGDRKGSPAGKRVSKKKKRKKENFSGNIIFHPPIWISFTQMYYY